MVDVDNMLREGGEEEARREGKLGRGGNLNAIDA
jgi:hypothetical protein